MEEENRMGVVYFHFHPFSTDPAVSPLLFVDFLVSYLGSLIGNITTGLTVWRDHSPHTPMYFFLFALAVLAIGYFTNIAPLTLADILSTGHMLISLPGCGAYMFPFILLGGSDCVLLAVMAYDRYMAICHPVRYHIIMSWWLCGQMTLGSLGLGFLLSLPLTILICHLPFCGRNEIFCFFCDMPDVMHLACVDTRMHKAALYAISVAAVAVPFLLICLSYGYIVATILRMNSAEGKCRAFSTCSSHLIVVLLQFGCCTLIYLHPSPSSSPEEGRAVSVVYTFFAPVLNPLIYSIRSQEVTDVGRRLTVRTCWFRKPEIFLPRRNIPQTSRGMI